MGFLADEPLNGEVLPPKTFWLVTSLVCTEEPAKDTVSLWLVGYAEMDQFAIAPDEDDGA